MWLGRDDEHSQQLTYAHQKNQEIDPATIVDSIWESSSHPAILDPAQTPGNGQPQT